MVINNSDIALVTGASRGIGYALVEELILNGWKVVGVARSREALDEMSKKFSEDVFISCDCDVSNSESVKVVSKRLQEKGVIPTLFFLNAGIAGEAACEDVNVVSTQKHREIFNTNYFGVMHWIEQWESVYQKDHGARFVVTSSINAIFAPPRGAAYAASKAAIAKAFEGFALTYHNTNLKFSVVYAGPVATDGLKGTLPFTWSPKKMAKYMLKNTNKGKSQIYNSLFYSWLARILRLLPRECTLKILGRLQ
ncbi:MAG: SDR family NAD(P)-dependent oxidoreductase [Chlamydiales bacterium]